MGREFSVDRDVMIDGAFRDIFGLNLITDKHLDREVKGTTLRELLRHRNSKFGQYSKLAENWYEWVVPREIIQTVRNEFLASGLLDPRLWMNGCRNVFVSIGAFLRRCF